jgi:hypothetical protein
LSFHYLKRALQREAFNPAKAQITSMFSCVDQTFSIKFKKSLSNARSQNFSPVVSSQIPLPLTCGHLNLD